VTTADLYAYLIIIGSSILGAAFWLLYQYRTQLQRTQELIQLNETLHYDLPNFLRQCWPILTKGGVQGLQWELEWFGTSLESSHGQAYGDVLERLFEVQDIKLRIRLYHMKRGWERRYFSLAQAENFCLLLRMNLWIKLGSVQGAFEQTAKMTVFFKHDVKNMVQLLSLSAEQLHNTPTEHEPRLLENLRAAIPAVLDRAERMLRALNEQAPRRQKQPELLDEPTFALETILAQTAALYDLPVTIEGHAKVVTDRDRLLSIVDNLLGNYSRLARTSNQRPHLLIAIVRDNNKVVTCIEDRLGNPFAWPERLFEPFWSEHGDGRGIGLYQSRQQALAAGGDLSASAEPNKPLRFYLSLPSLL
jgi:signal transduction histidine kinase